jgi:hypothetical protein
MELTWQLCLVWRQQGKSVKWHINIPQYMFYIESFPLINLQEAKNITHIKWPLINTSSQAVLENKKTFQ